MERNLLRQLGDVRWSVMSRTFGSSHATLIGLLIEWWVSQGPDYSALEGGPTCGPPEAVQPGQRGGQCDAALMRHGLSVGVLEVEGTRDDYTFRKLKHFFDSPLPDLRQLEFGAFVGYAIGPVGRGHRRAVEALPLQRWTEAACHITNDHPNREMAIIAVEKCLDVCKSGPRARNIYYQCQTSRVHGVLVRSGRRIDQVTLWKA